MNNPTNQPDQEVSTKYLVERFNKLADTCGYRQDFLDAAYYLTHLQTRINELEQPEIVEDGFGSSAGRCQECGCMPTVIRPGDIRCMNCENLQYLTTRCEELEAELKEDVKLLYGFSQEVDAFQQRIQQLEGVVDEAVELLEVGKINKDGCQHDKICEALEKLKGDKSEC